MRTSRRSSSSRSYDHVTRGRQRAVPGDVAGPGGEQPEAPVEAGGHLVDRHRVQPGGGELDRQRQAVEPGHDVVDGRAFGGRRLEPGPHRPRPLDEQELGRPVGGERQRRHRAQLLARDAQALAAGREDGDAPGSARRRGRRARRPDRARARSCRAAAPATSPRAATRCGRWPGRSGAGRCRARWRRCRAPCPATTTPARRARPAAPGRSLSSRCPTSISAPRLADAARPEHRDDAAARSHRGGIGDELVPADERRHRRRQAVPRPHEPGAARAAARRGGRRAPATARRRARRRAGAGSRRRCAAPRRDVRRHRARPSAARAGARGAGARRRGPSARR